MWVVSCVVLVALGGAGFAAYHLLNRQYNPIEPEIIKQANFTVFYPSEVPENFRMDKKSVTLTNNMLFFNFTKGKKTINITEQPLPALGDIVLAQLGFSKLEIRRGKAYIGTNGAEPVALVAIDKTLISINGSPDVSIDVVSSFAERMQILSID
jgi:hypothetical protein